MPIAYVVTVVIAFLVWKIPAPNSSSSIHGLVTAANLLFIVFKILLLNTLGVRRHTRHSTRIHRHLPGQVVQAIIIAWLFGSFIEGAAGFGPGRNRRSTARGHRISAMVVIVVALIIQSTCFFGAVERQHWWG